MPPSQISSIPAPLATLLTLSIFWMFLSFIATVLFPLMLFAFWIWMLISVTCEPPGRDKMKWVFLVILTGPIGGLIYFYARYARALLPYPPS